jgi:hypothetical protein
MVMTIGRCTIFSGNAKGYHNLSAQKLATAISGFPDYLVATERGRQGRGEKERGQTKRLPSLFSSCG